MSRLHIRSILVAGLVALLLVWAGPSSAPASESVSSGADPEVAVQAEVDEELTARRRAMIEDAHAALDETHNALSALDEGKTDEALDALARATGRLELLIARDPGLALAPVDVQVVTYDLYATPKAIRKARSRAEELLDDGRVQEARTLLSGLASEVVISVTSLPLATYPDAIKAVSPLIDAGEIEEARTALSTALNTLVVTDQVIPLPVLRARSMLDEAQKHIDAAEGSDDANEEKQQAAELVEDARQQLEMADLLGYGTESEHEALRRQLAELDERISAEDETRGLFARVRRSLDDLETSLLQ